MQLGEGQQAGAALLGVHAYAPHRHATGGQLPRPAPRAVHPRLQAHGQALLDSRQVDLLETVIASLDGEKDPRCLVLGLRCVRCAAQLYGAQPPDSLHAQRLEVGRGVQG